MKNCDDMVNSLLERREQYVAKQKKRKKVLVNTASIACCVCLAALIGFGVRNDALSITPSEQTVSDAVYPGIKDNFDEKNGESAGDPTANDKIIVHNINNITADKMNICLWGEDFVQMTLDELTEYYGVNCVPTIPNDITAWEDQRLGIYKRNGGTGEIYWDVNILNFDNKDFTRSVHLEVAKGRIPLCDSLYFGRTEEKSVINNVEIFIGVTESGYYYTEFVYQGVGFIIDAHGVSQDEFVAIISSLIK